MADAGHDAVLPASELETPYPPEVLATAEAYTEQAGGDLRLALIHAVADGFAVAGLVSRGFARWGQPAKRSLAD